jgi:hypothetical protein
MSRGRRAKSSRSQSEGVRFVVHGVSQVVRVLGFYRFCGGGGPSTLVTIMHRTSSISIRMSDAMTLRRPRAGTLRRNCRVSTERALCAGHDDSCTSRGLTAVDGSEMQENVNSPSYMQSNPGKAGVPGTRASAQ